MYIVHRGKGFCVGGSCGNWFVFCVYGSNAPKVWEVVAVGLYYIYVFGLFMLGEVVAKSIF